MTGDDPTTPIAVRATLGGRALRGWRRLRCAACGLPTDVCVCDELPTVATVTRIAVVMHRIESVRSTNTGRLVVKVVADSVLRVRGARDDVPTEAPPGRRLVLFPSESARPLCGADADGATTLVVPDGSWAQARRIARRDPWAREAECVSLHPTAASRYGLRRNPREGGLCTIEAVAAALAVLEGPSAAQPLLDAFELWRARAATVRRPTR